MCLNTSGKEVDNMGAITMEPDVTVQTPLDPEQVYQLTDGRRLSGRYIISLEKEKRHGKIPFIAYFCPGCNRQLQLISSGFHCCNCGLVSQEA